MKKSLLRLRLIFILTLSILLFSCGTTKQNIKTHTDVQAALVTNTDSISKDVSTQHKEMTTVRDSTSNEAEIIQSLDVTLSVPDSTGRQYPVRILQTEKIKVKAINVGAVSLRVDDLKQTISKSASSSSALQVTRKETTKSKIVKKPPSAGPTLIILIILVLVGLLILYRTPFITYLKRIITLFKPQ